MNFDDENNSKEKEERTSYFLHLEATIFGKGNCWRRHYIEMSAELARLTVRGFHEPGIGHCFIIL